MTLHATVLNLPRRTDRWLRCLEIAAATPGLVLEQAWTPEIPGLPTVGCALAHQIAVHRAALAGDAWVLVLEDDFELAPGFDISKALDLIQAGEDLGFDALYGGTVSHAAEVVATYRPPEVESRRIVETTTYLSSHFVVYYRSGYEKVLAWPIGTTADLYTRSRRPKDAMRRGLAVPFLATQRDGFSDTNRRAVEFDGIWARAETTWTRATP